MEVLCLLLSRIMEALIEVRVVCFAISCLGVICVLD